MTSEGFPPLKKIVQLNFAGKMLRELMQELVRTYGADIKNPLLDGNVFIDKETRLVLNAGTY